MADIAIERFNVDVSSSSQIYTLQNDVGDTSKAFVRLIGSTDKASGGPVGSTGNAEPNDVGCGVLLSNTTTLEFDIGNTVSRRIMGEVWRYTGPDGGAYEFVNRQSGSVTLSSGDSAQIAAISGISDKDQVIPLYTGYSSTAASVNDYDASSLACHIDSASNIVFSRNNTGTGTHIAYYNAVEFIGSAWSVGHAVSSAHDTNGGSGGETVTMNTDSTGTGGSTFDVTDWADAVILEGTMEGDSSETGLSDSIIFIYPAGTTTQVTFRLDNGSSRNDGTAYAHILQCDDLIVARTEDLSIAEGNNTYGTLSLPTGTSTSGSTNDLFMEWYPGTNGEGTAHARGRLIAELNDDAIEYSEGQTVLSTEYTSTNDMEWTASITFAATPGGIVYEAGGTGTGTFVGFNNSGEFIARSGNGGSLNPADAARIVVPTSSYDFAGRTGLLYYKVDTTAWTNELRFDENSNGTIDFSTSATTSVSPANWSGGDDGGVGTGNGNYAGSELTGTPPWSGSISSLIFRQGTAGLAIRHWVHRSGNNIKSYYAVVNLVDLVDVPVVSQRRIFII